MQLNFRILPLIALAAFSILPASVSFAAESRDVTGQAVDEVTGKPVEGAVIEATSMARNLYRCKDGHVPEEGKNCKGEHVRFDTPEEAKTDKDGRFSYANVPDGTTISTGARKDNYTYGAGPEFTVGPGMGSVVVKMTPLAGVAGTVRDARGAPLKMVQAQLCARNGRQLSCSLSDNLKDGGSFHFGNVSPGKYYIVAEPIINEPVDANSYRSYLLQADGSKVDVGDIQQSGQKPVRDAKGQAIGYVPVRYPAASSTDANPVIEVAQGGSATADIQLKTAPLYRVSGSSGDTAVLSVTDANGTSTFYQVHVDMNTRRFDVWLPDGQYTISDPYQPGRDMDFKVSGADINNMDFTKPVQSPVTFKLTIRHSAACQHEAFGCGAALNITFENLKDGMKQPLFPNPNDPNTSEITLQPGKYALHVMTFGKEYVKEARAGNMDLNSQPLQVGSDAHANTIQFVMGEGGVLEGTITKNGKPNDAWLYAMPEKQGIMEAPFFSTSANYQLPGLAPGVYYVLATDDQLNPDFSDAKTVEQWKKIGKKVTVGAGETKLDLEVSNLAATGEGH
jgi:hypothetical protein